MRNFEGENYHKVQGLYGKSLSETLKTELKQWLADYNKVHAHTKYSVTIKRSRGGWTTSLIITVKSKNNYIKSLDISEGGWIKPIYKDWHLQFMKDLKRFIESYNYDKSDIMTDYFDVKFYHRENECTTQLDLFINELKTELFKNLYSAG